MPTGRHPADVGLDSGLGEHELFGDLGIGEPLRNEPEDFVFTIGEPGQSHRRTRCGVGRDNEPLEHASGSARCDDGVTGMDVADRAQQRFGLGILQQEGRGTARSAL